jgi:hypothetical protein
MKVLKKLVIAFGSVAAFSMGTVEAAQAGTFINFEPVNGELPDGSLAMDDLKISNQFSSLGVSFGLDNNLDGIADGPNALPVLEAVGKDQTDGFVNAGLGTNDVAAPGFEDRLGDYFLRTSGLGGNGGRLLITYENKPTSAASGELWDIDGNKNNRGQIRRTEKWVVEALGQDRSVIDTIISPEGTSATDSGDGAPWFWSFERAQADIYAIRFNFVGQSDPSQVGLAFDNFSAYSVEGKESVPEPASVLGVLAVGAFGTASSLRRKKK